MKSLPSTTLDNKRTQWLLFLAIALLCLMADSRLCAQTGPFYPTNWAPTNQTNSHCGFFLVKDPSPHFSTPPRWHPSRTLANRDHQDFYYATPHEPVCDRTPT